jgi:hypothetical protein
MLSIQIIYTMENNEEKKHKRDLEDINDDRTGSDADIDRGITDGEFAGIGTKQAGDNNIEEEMKGSDADRSV